MTQKMLSNILDAGISERFRAPMNNGLDGMWRVWSDLQRKEDQLKWGSGYPGHGPQYDSMGRLSSSSSFVHAGWLREQPGRVGRVRTALRESGPMAKRLILQTLSGINITTVVDILVAVANDFALYYGGSVITGGIIGGIGGTFLGGIGAVPGAIAGASAGGYVGGWLMALLGLKSLVEGIVHAIPEALRYYTNGFAEAWGPVRQDLQHGFASAHGGNTQSAAMDIARGHLILISALLTVMITYLTRGKGDRTVLLQEVSQSKRLGPKMAKWLEENEERLQRHPALQSRSRGGSAAESSPPPPQKRQRGPEEQALRVMPKAKVPCFKPNSLPQGSFPEFDRQLAGQEAGINAMTVEEYLAGRDAFDKKLSVRDPNIARKARSVYERNLTDTLIEQLQASGMSPMEAEEQATEQVAQKMKALAALHNPDMVAGGKDVIADFGNENINKRIGAQWNKGGRLMALDDAAARVPEALRSTIKMNAGLVRCP